MIDWLIYFIIAAAICWPKAFGKHLAEIVNAYNAACSNGDDQ